MNLNKREINEKVRNIKGELRELKASLKLSPDDLYENRQNVFWYNGEIGKVKYKNFTITVETEGEVKAHLYHADKLLVSIDDKKNLVYDKMHTYINSDVELQKILKYSQSIKLYKKNYDGYYLSLKKSNKAQISVFDNLTNTFINIPCDITNTNDVLDIFDNVKYYIKALDEYCFLKNQANKISKILFDIGTVFICKKVDDKIRCVNIKLINQRNQFANFEIYEALNNPIHIKKDTIFPSEILNFTKSFSYICPTNEKLISETCSLIPLIIDEIKIVEDFNEEFMNFIYSNKKIAAFGYEVK